MSKGTPITRDMLSSSEIYLVDFGGETYLWNGKHSSLEARRFAKIAGSVSILHT